MAQERHPGGAALPTVGEKLPVAVRTRPGRNYRVTVSFSGGFPAGGVHCLLSLRCCFRARGKGGAKAAFVTLPLYQVYLRPCFQR